MAKIAVEIWASYIVEKLRRTNPHLALCVDESQHVKGGAIVHIPQAGAKSNVVRNRSFGPATAVQRGDSSISYALDVFTTDPTAITFAENMEISYDKTDSVLGDHVGSLTEAAGDWMIYNWIRGLVPQNDGSYATSVIPSSRQIATTGAAVAVNPEDGQTGSRLALTYKELDTASAKFNKDGVPKEGRYAMLESYMLKQLIDSLSSNQMATFQQAADVANGIVGKWAGFTILERSFVLAQQAGGTFRIPGEALAATDNLACLLWQKDSVAKAMGDTELFQDFKNPLYYGDIHSALLKLGGRCRRAGWEGIAIIKQAPTS